MSSCRNKYINLESGKELVYIKLYQMEEMRNESVQFRFCSEKDQLEYVRPEKRINFLAVSKTHQQTTTHLNRTQKYMKVG